MMKLVYTPKSHFARKVRILLDAWDEPTALLDAGDVADEGAESFAQNPLMQVPALMDAGKTIFDSDNIAKYLVRRRAQGDVFDVESSDVETLNARVVMNGVMSAEVEVLLAERTGIDIRRYKRFEKKVETIDRGLDWLEAHKDIFEGRPTYAGFHLVAMWDHLSMNGFLKGEYPGLEKHVAKLSELPYVAQSRPRM